MFELRQYLLLFLVATIWGSGFVAQKLGLSYISPFAFTFYRTLIGGLCLIPLIMFLSKVAHKKGTTLRCSSKRKLIIGSLACGFCLFISESFQQFGLVYTDVNKASFITSLYMIFVPLIGIFLGHKITKKIVLCVVLSFIGLYLFTVKGSLTFEVGDLLVLICALGFAFHILVIAYFINYVDGVMLSCGQFFCASCFGFILMLITGAPAIEDVYKALLPLLYAGALSNGIAYTFQIVAQRGISPTIASLIMSLESVMGAIFGVTFLSEAMSRQEIIGATLMFGAVILTQIKIKRLD